MKPLFEDEGWRKRLGVHQCPRPTAWLWLLTGVAIGLAIGFVISALMRVVP